MKLNDQLYLKLNIYKNHVKLGDIAEAIKTHEEIVQLMERLGE